MNSVPHTVPAIVPRPPASDVPPTTTAAITSSDGAFASTDTLADTKTLGVTDGCFAKKRGLAILDMVRSQWVYDRLRRFWAGIEAGIALFKRVFGLARCVRKGARGFHAYVRTAVLAANLLVLARARLT